MSFFGKSRKDNGPVMMLGDGINFDNPMKVVPISVPDRHRQRHSFIFGTTGCGKTRLAELMIEQDIRRGNSVVYFDPKGDKQIFTRIFDVARQCGREHELMLVTPIFPEYSAVINPLSHYYMVDEIMSHTISGIPAGKDPFFRNVAKEITTVVAMGHIILAKEEGKRPKMNFDIILESIRRSALEDMQGALKRIGHREAIWVAERIQDILESPQDYYAKVSSTLRTELMELSAGNTGRIIGKAETNRFMKKLEEGERVILICHTGSMLARESAATLGKVILSMIQAFIGRVNMSNREKVDPPLSIYMDEAQSLFYPGVEDLFAKAGSAGVMVHALAQSVNSVFSAIGEDFGKVILDNTNTKIFMRCSDAETSEYVVKHFGVKNVLSGIYSAGQVTAREVEQDVLKTQNILNLLPQEFYMMSYSGRWKGKTMNIKDSDLKIVFPDAPAN